MKNSNTQTTQNSTIGTSLTADDLRNLSDCFITPDIAELAGLSRLTDEEGAAVLNRKRNASDDYRGLATPYKNPKTGQILEYEIRRDFPGTETKNGREKEVGKYLRPVGSKSLAYFVPGTNTEHFKDTLVTMIATEGTKKALAMLNASTDNLSKPLPFLIVGFSGVDNFKTSQTEIKATGEKRQVKDILPELKEIDFEGREVLIIYDANVFSNKNVYFARHRLAETLLDLGAIVYYINLPQIEGVNGIDDLLGYWKQQHGKEKAIQKFAELLKTKRRFVRDAVYSRPLADDKLTLKIESGDRNKVKVSALDADGKTVDLHEFNPADADKRSSFIKKQIEPAFHPSETEKQEITRELIRLADLAEIVTRADKSKDNANGETVETSFKVFSDGRIFEQIRGGAALYNPETNEHEIVDTVTDEDGTIYKPVEDDLFSEGGLKTADDLTEYGTEADLIADIESYIAKYLDLKPLQLKLTVFYILLTFLFDKFLELSYINATGDAGSGKSRFGQAVALASRRGLILITPSAASVYRITDKFKPTLFLDEFNGNDTDDGAAIIQILNAGFQQTGKIARQFGAGDGKFKSELFDPYCPKIIGSLKQSKSNAFNSRCVEIQMERTTRNDIPLSLSFQMLNEAQALQNKLTLYRLRNYHKDFDVRRMQAENELKAAGIVARSVQVNTPLYALIEDREIKREFINLLKGRDEILAEEKSLSLDGEIIDAIHTLLFDVSEEETVLNAVNFSDLPAEGEICEQLRVERLRGMINASRPNKEIAAQSFGKILIGLGLKTKKILKRSSEHRDHKAMIFNLERLNYLFKIYNLPVSAEFNVTNVTKNQNYIDNNGLAVVTYTNEANNPETICHQVKPNTNNIYKNGDIGDIKNPETNSNNKKYVQGVV